MLHLLLLLALSMDAGRMPPAREVVCSFAEVNHKHNDAGKHEYDQVILWQWDSRYRRYNVLTWYLTDGLYGMPTKQSGEWVIERLLSRDHRLGSKLVRIRPGFVIETWTQKDPERENAKLLSEKKRLKIQ